MHNSYLSIAGGTENDVFPFFMKRWLEAANSGKKKKKRHSRGEND
jgi:hypothetical protein